MEDINKITDYENYNNHGFSELDYENCNNDKFNNLFLRLVIDNKYDEILDLIKDDYNLLLLNRKRVLGFLLNSNFYGTQLEKNVTEIAKHNFAFASSYISNMKSLPLILSMDKEIMEKKLATNVKLFDMAFMFILATVKSGNEEFVNRIFENKIPAYVLLYRSLMDPVDDSLLKLLFSKYPDRTIDYIKKNELYNDKYILSFLEIYEVDIEKEFGVDRVIGSNSERKSKYMKNMYDSYIVGDLNEHLNALLNELRIAFLEDGQSDVPAIELACKSFKYLFLTNYKFAKRDLKSMLNIKKDYEEFRIVIGDHSSFSPAEGLIELQNQYDISAFNHELTHAIHWYACDAEFSIPSSYSVIEHKVNEDVLEEFIKFYSEYEEGSLLDKFEDAKKSIYEQVDKAPKKEYDSNIFSDDSYDKVEMYLKANPIDSIHFEMYSLDVDLEESLTAFLQPYTVVFAMVDSITNGKFYDEHTISTEYFERRVGHGSKYFEKYENGDFVELIAQYNEIIKSPLVNEQILDYLNKILGKDLIKILDDFNSKLEYVSFENMFIRR